MKKILFIVNPVSGGKDKEGILRIVGEEIGRKRFEYETVLTACPGHATSIASECDADIVVAVGGDGTVSEVAKGIAGTSKTLGIIPCGSGDGLALHLGISRNPRKAARQLCEARFVPMDYGLVCGHPFFCTTGVGFDAVVSKDFAASRTRGLLTYITTAWNAWKHFTPEEYTLDADGVLWKGKAALITVGNVNQWGNNAKIAPGASVVDGKLDITIVTPFNLADILPLAARLMTGHAAGSRKTICMRAGRIRITRAGAAPAHFDGDPIELGSSLDITVAPSKVNVAVPSGKKKI